jgi:hypothetical protein
MTSVSEAPCADAASDSVIDAGSADGGGVVQELAGVLNEGRAGIAVGHAVLL